MQAFLLKISILIDFPFQEGYTFNFDKGHQSRLVREF